MVKLLDVSGPLGCLFMHLVSFSCRWWYKSTHLRHLCEKWRKSELYCKQNPLPELHMLEWVFKHCENSIGQFPNNNLETLAKYGTWQLMAVVRVGFKHFFTRYQTQVADAQFKSATENNFIGHVKR